MVQLRIINSSTSTVLLVSLNATRADGMVLRCKDESKGKEYTPVLPALGLGGAGVGGIGLVGPVPVGSG